MIRNLKVLGLALAAIFALSAVAASAASAQVGTLTSDGPVKLVGKNTGGANANALTASFGGKANKVECASAHYTGFKSLTLKETEEGKKHVFIPNDVSTFTVVAEYGTCVAFAPGLPEAGVPATVDMNGCDYVFHLGETVVGGKDEYKVTNTVICPSGKHITVTLFSNAAKHTENKPFCHITIFEKTGENPDYSGLIAKDTTNGTGDITGTVEGIKAEKNTGVLCPSETDNNAKLDLDITVEGKNEIAGSTGVSISHL